jgi:hypothetical protein
MTQVAQSVSVDTLGASLASGISCTFAARIADGIERGESKQEVVDAMLRLQEGLHAICCRCGAKWPIRLISRSYARRVYNLGRSVALPDLIRNLDRRLSEHVASCPRCGRGGAGLGHNAAH